MYTSRMAISPHPELLTVTETAARLRLTTKTVYGLIDTGVLPAIRVSERGLRVSSEDLAAYLADQNAGRPRWNETIKQASRETRGGA